MDDEHRPVDASFANQPGYARLGVEPNGDYQFARLSADKHFLLRLCDEDRARIDALTAALRGDDQLLL